MLQLTHINNIPKSMKIRDTVIKTNIDPHRQIEEAMQNYEKVRDKDTLITSDYVLDEFQKFYQLLADIMTGKIDIEPYLPWRSGKSDGLLPTDREILIKSSLLYKPINSYIEARYVYQLRLIPEIETYMTNITEHTGDWVIVVDLFPCDSEIVPIIATSTGKMQKYRVVRGHVLDKDKLEHKGIYLDSHGAEWIVLKNIKIYVDDYVMLKTGDDPGQTQESQYASYWTTEDTLYIRADRMVQVNMSRNSNIIRTSAQFLGLVAQSIQAPRLNLVYCLTESPVPKLIKKIGTVSGITSEYKDSSFECSYDNADPVTVHKYTIEYNPEVDDNAQ